MTSPQASGHGTTDTSHGRIVRATSILGGASVVNIALGLIKMKVAAVVLGPVGVGVIGLLQNLLNAVGTVGGLNMGIAGSRQIIASEAERGPQAAASARRAILITTAFMAAASAVLFWLLREPLTALIFGDAREATQVGLLAIGVAATAAAGYTTAVLTAARRIGDLARVTIISAVVSAIVGSVWIIIGGTAGIVPFILAGPVTVLVFGWFFVQRLPSTLHGSVTEPLEPHVASLLRMGAALTISIFVSLCGWLIIRTTIERQLGGARLGHFQAAFTITYAYLQFVFQAMGSEYLPRLTGAMRDRDRARRMVREQAEAGLMLGAPVILAMIGAAPWVLSILYTSAFVEASTLLRWQILGDLLQLASWPVGFVLLAGGSGRDYTIANVGGTIILVIVSVLLLPVTGLTAPGIGYVVMNLCYGAAVMWLVTRRYEIGLSVHVVRLFALLAANSVLVFVIGEEFPGTGAAVGVAASALWAWFGYSRLQRAGALPFGRAGK